MKRTFLCFAILFLLTACTPRELTVEDAWSRPALAGNNGAVYFVIHNPTGEDDTLLNVSTQAAGTAEMHTTMAVEGEHDMENMDHDMPMAEALQMVKQDSVPVPSGEDVLFAPGGNHVMLVGLNADLVVGDTIEITLTFEKAGEITLQVPVEEGR